MPDGKLQARQACEPKCGRVDFRNLSMFYLEFVTVCFDCNSVYMCYLHGPLPEAYRKVGRCRCQGRWISCRCTAFSRIITIQYLVCTCHSQII